MNSKRDIKDKRKYRSIKSDHVLKASVKQESVVKET